MGPTVTRVIVRAVILTVGISPLLDAQGVCPSELPSKLFRRTVNEQFANLVSPQSATVLGSFAGLDIKDAKATFAAALVPGNGGVLGIKAQGAISEGILALFNNSELNADVGLEVQYHFLAGLRQVLRYEQSSRQRYCADSLKIEAEYGAGMRAIELNYAETHRKLDSLRLLDSIASLTKKRDAIVSGTLQAMLQRDSLAIEITKLEGQVGAKRAPLPGKAQQRVERGNERDAKVRELDKLLKFQGFALGWFSIGYGVSKSSFRLFDPSQPPESQVTKRTFVPQHARLQYSYYNHAPWNSYFLSISAGFSVEDNLAELTKHELTDTKSYGDTATERVSTRKYNAFEGAYRDHLSTLTIAGDAYWFLFADSQAAIHFYPAIVMKEDTKPSANLGFGYLSAFKTKEKTRLNAEAYVVFNNVANSGGVPQSVSRRSSVGLRFAFPVDFK